jgi:hypothetical protein
MAARTGAGTGVVVGLVVFVLSTIFLLVLTIVFYSKQQKAIEEREAAMSELSNYATRLEQNSDEFKAIMQNRGAESAMRYLLNERQNIMGRVVGNRQASSDQLQTTISAYAPDDPDAIYAHVMQRMQNDLNATRQEMEGHKDRAAAMEQQLTESQEMLRQAEENRRTELEGVRNTIAQFIADVEAYNLDVTETKARMMEMVSQLEARFGQEVDGLESQLDQSRTDLALANQELETYREMRAQAREKRNRPDLLVDGSVLEAPNSQGQVFINRGSEHHITLGMTFEVYDDATMLTPDDEGNMPRGKASLEVITVGDSTSTAKVTRSSAGRPVVRGDVIANAVYDPEKKFLFLVHGRFDVDGDGRPSTEETTYIRSLITNWGGLIAEGDEIRGDLDFLLLGVQPPAMPELPDNASNEQVEIWLRGKAALDKYNQLLRDAQKAHIPVLNQNRFFTLIGHTYQ